MSRTQKWAETASGTEETWLHAMALYPGLRGHLHARRAEKPHHRAGASESESALCPPSLAPLSYPMPALFINISTKEDGKEAGDSIRTIITPSPRTNSIGLARVTVWHTRMMGIHRSHRGSTCSPAAINKRKRSKTKQNKTKQNVSTRSIHFPSPPCSLRGWHKVR